MSRASVNTILPLDEWARYLGIAPAHFNQIASSDAFPVKGTCLSVWFQHAWQSPNNVSREEVADAVRNAEEDIARVLNFYPGPRWVENEEVQMTRHYLKTNSLATRNVKGQAKSVKLDFGKVLAVGRRAVAYAGEATVVYSDYDADGYDELATVTIDITGTAAADIIADANYTGNPQCDLKVYFQDVPSMPVSTEGDQEWEIRPMLRTEFDTTTNIYEARGYSWGFVKPELWEAFPTQDNSRAIEFDVANFVTTVDVYLEYTDWTSTSTEFFWRNENCSGSVPCPGISQQGCAYIKDSELGLIVPYPASFNETTNIWDLSQPSSYSHPDRIRAWYRSGDHSDAKCWYMNPYWAQAVVWLSVARLVKPICSCNNVSELAEELREDMSVGSPAGNYIIPIDDVVKNPFGTRKGEVMAWRRIKSISGKSHILGASIL